MGVVLVAVAFAVTGALTVRLLHQIDEMPRIAMPGRGTVELAAGTYTGYAEPRGAFGAVAVGGRCGAVDAQGKPIVLRRPLASTRYGIGSRQGASLVELEVTAAGPVTIACETSTPFDLALGSGIGSALLAVIAGVFASLISAVVVTVTWVRRRRAARRAAIA